MNTKTFTTTISVVLDRSAWKSIGFGDQPSRREVQSFFSVLFYDLSAPGPLSTVKVRYAGAPGSYAVEAVLTVEAPVWRRLGFGDRASRREVESKIGEELAKVAKTYKVEVK